MQVFRTYRLLAKSILFGAAPAKTFIRKENRTMQRFALNQKNVDGKQSAELFVPGCGAKTQDNGPVAFVEFQDGKPVLYIWSDINQEDWTHRIDLSDALESSREEEKSAPKSKRKKDEPADKPE